MSTRIHARDEARYDRKLINMMLEDGMAKAFGEVIVIRTDEGSYAVRPHQIIDYPAAAFTILIDGVEFDDNQAEADLAAFELRDSEVQDYLAKAQVAGISVEEYTDGEYYVNNGRVFPASAREVL